MLSGVAILWILALVDLYHVVTLINQHGSEVTWHDLSLYLVKMVVAESHDYYDGGKSHGYYLFQSGPRSSVKVVAYSYPFPKPEFYPSCIHGTL